MTGLNCPKSPEHRQREECRYCGGNCPNEPDDSEYLCDGFAGDIDGLYAEGIKRFNEIMEEMLKLTEEAVCIVERKTTRWVVAQRARSYWGDYIKECIENGRSEFFKGHRYGMKASLEELGGGE